MDQFMHEFKHKCVDMCKSNNTNVSGEGNTIVFMSTLASRLKEARKDKKLSQESLSRLLGADHGSFVGNVESGRNKSFSKIVQAAEVLGVNALWLAEGKGPKSAASLKMVRYAIDEAVEDEGINKKNNLSQELPFYDIGRPAGTLVDELQSRYIPPHIEQAIMALLQTCQKRDKKP